MFIVYILKLSNNQLYTGFTSELDRRLEEHRTGKVKSTEKRRPLELIHYEVYELKSDAMRREKFLKTTEGKKLLKMQIKDVLKKKNIIE
jgi:putative endonuclease